MNAYDQKTGEEEGDAERLLFVPEGLIWDPSSFDGMSWNDPSLGGYLPPPAPTATQHEKRAHFLLTYRCWCLTRHNTVLLSSGWPLCVPAGDLGQWCREEEKHFASVEEVQRLVALHDQPDVASYFDPDSPECQLQHLAQLGLKAITIATFGNGRRNQEPRAILDNGLLRSQDGQEEYSWSNSLVQYHYDENDASRSEVGIVLLTTNAKTVMEFVTAGGHGAVLGRDGEAQTYNRTRDKMREVLEK